MNSPDRLTLPGSQLGGRACTCQCSTGSLGRPLCIFRASRQAVLKLFKCPLLTPEPPAVHPARSIPAPWSRLRWWRWHLFMQHCRGCVPPGPSSSSGAERVRTCIAHCRQWEIPSPARNPSAADWAAAWLKGRKTGETGMMWWSWTNFFCGAVQLGVVFMIVVFRDEFAKSKWQVRCRIDCMATEHSCCHRLNQHWCHQRLPNTHLSAFLMLQ